MVALCSILANLASASDLIFGDGFDPPPTLSLSTTTPQSLERVGIDGLPADWRTPGDVAVEFVNVQGTRPMPVERDASGWFVLAPFHPAFPEQGGSVTLRAVRGQVRSTPFTLEVRPLDDAPGAFLELTSTLRAHIDGFARQRGSSFEALQAMSFEETPDSLFPLKYAQSFVNDPDNPDSLAFIADGTSDFLSAGERRFLDQVSGKTALAALLGLEIAGLGELPSRSVGASNKNARQDVLLDIVQRGTACIDAGPAIGDAATLSTAMWQAKFAEIAISGDPANTLTALSATLAAGSAIPGYGKAFLAAGAATAAWQASRGALAGLNPSRFVSISADVTRRRFEEDSLDSGQYLNVQVVAASTGWVADQAIVDAVITALGVAASGAQVGQITAADFLKDSAVNTINIGVSNHVGAQAGGAVKFCPQQWTIDISSTLWSEARSVFGHFDISGRTFKPNALQEDFLSVSNIASQFGQEKIDVDIAIGVDPIVVTATPQRIQVSRPGGIKQITTTVDNAVVPSLFWDPGPGSWDDGQLEPTNDDGTRPLKLPADPDLYPFIVDIESLSRQGLRASNQPPRGDTVRVVLVDEIIVSPANACLENGSGEQFTATQGGEPASVVWSLEPTGNSPVNLGSITQTGTYAAPGSGSGDLLVVATSTEDADIRGTALVEVGSCECFWALSIAGDGSWSGSKASHVFQLPFGGAEFSMGFETDGGSAVGNAQIFAEPAVTAGATGVFPLDQFQFTTGSRSWFTVPEEATATLSVNENIDEVAMSGSIGGTVMTIENAEEILRSFDLIFRSAGVDGSCDGEF